MWRSTQDLEQHMRTPHMREFVSTFFEHRMDWLEHDLDAHTGTMFSPYPAA